MTEGARHRTASRGDRRAEHGQIIVVFALALFAILAMAGLLVDGGRAWSDHRIGQNAADTAALAAAKTISAGGNAAAAAVSARDVANANGYPSNLTTCAGAVQSLKGVVVNYPPLAGPHLGDNKYVEVAISRRLQTTFAAVVGQSCWLVSARAVAQTVPVVPSGPAMLAMDTACGGGGTGTFSWGGDHILIHGDVVSNGGLDYNSSGGSVDVGKTFTYRDPPPIGDGNCKYANHGNPAPNQAQPVSTIYTNPFTYTTADFHCTNAPPLLGKIQLPASGTVIPNGTYCASVSITLKTAGTRCDACTFIAPQVSVSAANVYLRPNEHNVLMWGSGTGNAIQYAGSGADWGGIIYAPSGLAQISGKNGASISGSIWAKTIDISGSGWEITPPSAAAGTPGVVKLVE